MIQFDTGKRALCMISSQIKVRMLVDIQARIDMDERSQSANFQESYPAYYKIESWQHPNIIQFCSETKLLLLSHR